MPTADAESFELHHRARLVLLEAFVKQGLPAPRLSELQGVGAVALGETQYGRGWRGAGAGSHNWSAVQCGHYAPCGEGCFEHGDRHADGTDYRGCFRKYGSDLEGARALLRELYRREGVPEALRAGDAQQVAQRMRATGYFEANAEAYGEGIALRAKQIAQALSEPPAVGFGTTTTTTPPPPLIPPPPGTGAPPPPPPPVWPWLLAAGGVVGLAWQSRRKAGRQEE